MRVNSRSGIGTGSRRIVTPPRPVPKPSPKPTPKPAPTPKPSPTVSHGYRVKEEREPQPAVVATPKGVSYGQRVTVDKTSSIGIYESHKKTYTEPSGVSMDIKIDGIGKKPNNRSIINTVDYGITKENTTKDNSDMVTYSINRGNGNIKSKREEIFASMKGDRQEAVIANNKNEKSGYDAVKREQISAEKREDRQSTYSVYNKYTRDSYINNKRAKIFADMKPENIEIAKEIKEDSSALNYLKRSGKQVILGNYTKDVTLLGTAGQIGAGLLDLDLPMDIRDITYDFTNWEWSWGHAGQTLLDLVGVLPIVGAIKYGDEVGTLVKTSIKNLDTAGDIAKKTEAISDVAKKTETISNATKATENVSDITKEMDKASEAAAKGTTKADILKQNRINGRNFETEALEKMKESADDVVEQITIKSKSGTRTRLDAIGMDKETGEILIEEYKHHQQHH